MIRRFLEFVLPLLILAAALCLLWGALTVDRGRTTYEAASPSARHGAAFSAPETSKRPSAPFPTTRPAPVEEAGVSTAGSGDPSPGSANQKVQVAMGSGLGPTTGSGGTSPLPSFPATCQSPCRVDVSEYDVPTPEPVAFNGIASHMGAGFPSWYLALPQGPGFIARICGPGGCVTRTSTDAGPSKAMQRYPYYRVADLSVPDFERVCGCPASFGLVPVSVALIGRAR